MNKKMKYIDFLINVEGYVPLYKEMEGRQHLVVPVVAIVEGVHNDLFYPADEIAKNIQMWNGVPVPIQHPKDPDTGESIPCNSPEVIDSQCVARFWNAYFDPDGGKLKGEIWIDVDKAQKISPETVKLLLSGGHMEVSTGLWADHEDSQGTWNGETYDAVLRNYQPDHLALLPGEEGACNWADGCGIRLNMKGGTINLDNDKKINTNTQTQEGKTCMEDIKKETQEKGKVMGFLKAVAEKFGLSVQETSHDDVRDLLRKLLYEQYNPKPINDEVQRAQEVYAWVREVYDDYFVYEVQEKLYKQKYTLDNDEASFKGDPTEVKLETKYVKADVNEQKEVDGGGTNGNGIDDPTDRKDNKSITTNDEEVKKQMEIKEKLVNGLIENGSFTEEDRKWLMEQDDCRLEKLGTLSVKEPETNVDKEAEAKAKEEAELKANAEAKAKEEAEAKAKADAEAKAALETNVEPDPKPQTADEYVANAPAEIKEVLDAGLKMQREKKANLVKGLLANKRNKFTEDQLKDKAVDELEKMAELANVPVDFSAQVGGKSAESELKENEKHPDGSGVPDMPVAKWNKDGSADLSEDK